MNQYDESLANQKVINEIEKAKKELSELKEKIEKSKKELNSTRSSCGGNYGSGSYSSGSYSSGSYLTEEEQSDLSDRMYERSHGYSRYDI